jgi:hypothetical protein
MALRPFTTCEDRRGAIWASPQLISANEILSRRGPLMAALAFLSRPIRDSSDRLDSRTVSRCAGESHVARGERRIDGLGQRNVRRVVCRKVLPQRPDARQEIDVRMTMEVEVGEVCQRFPRAPR